MAGRSNKRIKLARRSADGLTGGRRTRSLSAVRWTHWGCGFAEVAGQYRSVGRLGAARGGVRRSDSCPLAQRPRTSAHSERLPEA